MSTGATVAIIVVIVGIVAVAASSAVAARRRSQREAGADLAGRERLVRGLDIRPLAPAARAEYADQWTSMQERFVDQPCEAVVQAQLLVTAVLQDRGYPTEGCEQVLGDLSAQHARNLENYRAAHSISEAATSGSASTDDLRQAMIYYRIMLGDLLTGEAGAQDAGEFSMNDLASRPSGR